MKYSVNEIFASIQGEGLFVGKLMNFIRFSRCNLACKWCDTKFEECEELNEKEIIKKLDKRIRWVSLTGGEPMLENGLAGLIDTLHAAGYKVLLETNSTIYDKRILDEVDYISADIKPPSSGNSTWDKRVINYCFKNPKKSQIKIVFQNSGDIDFFLELYKGSYPNWILQPETSSLRSLGFMRLLKRIPDNVRIIPQTHKIMKVR
jgi:7-carboxy-7-deazaguanine synthase